MSIALKDELNALDNKDLDFYDNLTDEEKKKFSNYLMLRYASAVKGYREIEEYYLLATNKRVNKNFWDLNKHPKLQWMVVQTASPGIGNQYHAWIAPKKKKSTTAIRKFVELVYPNSSDKELDILASINDGKTCKEYAKELGWTDKEIKNYFK
jgi:hypothetical protein